jgi:hypothetical protein
MEEGINALRTATYAELLKVSMEQGLPKSWVESFFRKANDRTEAETEEETPPDASTP